MEHFPGRGLNVDAPPVDSSLARGFRAKRMPFLSCDVSASSAPANGGADVSQSRLCAVLSACVCVCAFLTSRSDMFMRGMWLHVVCVHLLGTKSTGEGREVYILC